MGDSVVCSLGCSFGGASAWTRHDMARARTRARHSAGCLVILLFSHTHSLTRTLSRTRTLCTCCCRWWCCCCCCYCSVCFASPFACRSSTDRRLVLPTVWACAATRAFYVPATICEAGARASGAASRETARVPSERACQSERATERERADERVSERASEWVSERASVF